MQTLSRLSGIPVEKMTQTDSKRYLNLESELHKRVIGQDEAVSAISRAIRRNQSGIRTGKRPIGSFMFLDLLVLVRQNWLRLWRKFSLMMNQLCFALICRSIWKICG